MEKNKKLAWQYILIFAIALGIRSISYLRHCTFIVRTDDFGTLIYPATLAGFDWREYISQVQYYYGYGYYWIFAPLFYFCSSFRTVFLSMLCINNVFICAIPMLVYKIETKYLKLPKNCWSMLLAVSASFLVGDNPMPTASTWYRTDNEIPIYFITWLLIAAVFATKECTDKKKRILWSIVIGLILVWGLTVHERANAMVIAVVAVGIYIFICRKKWIYNPIALYITVAIGAVIHKYVKTMICAYYWPTGANNTNAYKGISLYFLKSLAGFRAFCTIIIGNLHSLFIKTYGLPVIAIVILLVWIFRNGFFSGIVAKIRGKKRATEKVAIENDELLMMIQGVIFIIVVLGLAMRWGRGLTNGFATGQVVKNYKAICYSRYYYPVCGPLIVAVVAYLYSMRVGIKNIIKLSWGLFVFLEGIFLAFVYTITSSGAGAKYITRAQNIRVFNDPYINFWFGMIVMVVVLAVITAYVYKVQKVNAVKIIVLLMLVYNVAFRVRLLDFNNIGVSIKGEAMVEDFFQLAEDVDYDLTGKVYIVESAHEMNYVQLMKKEMTLHREIPEEGQEAVVFTNYKIKELEEQGYKYVKCKKFFVMTNISEYYPVLEKLNEQN